jgi:hypothetical protein
MYNAATAARRPRDAAIAGAREGGKSEAAALWREC